MSKKLSKVYQELVAFTDGVNQVFLNPGESGITASVVGTKFVRSGPLFTVTKVRKGEQALLLMLVKGDKFYHVNLVDLVSLARLGCDLPEQLDEQHLILLRNTANWNPDCYQAYVVGDLLDSQNGVELSFLEGLRQEYVLSLFRSDGEAGLLINLASLVAMARFAMVPDDCEENRE